MLTEKDLEQQKTFCKYNKDGNYYSGYWEFVIMFQPGRTILCHRNEVNGEIWRIKNLKDLPDLKNVYEAITDKTFE